MVVNEFVQLEDVEVLKGEIKKMNYKLLSAINDTNIIQELEKEKKAAIARAADISMSLLPQVQVLSSFINNEKPADLAPPEIKKQGAGRPRKVMTTEVEELDSELEQITKRGPGRPRKRRGPGRPRKRR